MGYDDVEPNPEAADTGAAREGSTTWWPSWTAPSPSYDAVLGADLEAASEDAAGSHPGRPRRRP